MSGLARVALDFRNRGGLFRGTFNPLHSAHLRVAAKALEQFALSKIVFIPNGIPPHKAVELGCSKEDRYTMVERAVADSGQMEVSRIEIDREGPSYTIDTIRAMKDDYPQGICFIVGADKLLELDTWKEPDALLRSVPFIVAPRAGVQVSAFHEPPFDCAMIAALEMEEVDLSSTSLRDMVARGAGIEDLVPSAVADYIKERGLYRNLELTGVHHT